MKPNLSAFASSPLITPERLAKDWGEALSIPPRWADAWGLTADFDHKADIVDVMLALGVASSRRGGTSTKISDRDENGGQWYVTAVFAAILAELTRHGNSVASNTNGKKGDTNALFYLKLSFATAKDNQPVARLILNAGAKEEVHRTLGDGLTPTSERYFAPSVPDSRRIGQT